MPTVLIAGGTGLIGQRLSELLRERSYEVFHLSRRENLQAEFPAYGWDIERGEINMEAVNAADYVINLAGAGIADKPWTSQRKQRIIDSRTETTALLLSAIQKREKPVRAFLSSAAIGYYGDRGETLLTEDSAPGQEGFLAESCRAWETAISRVAEAGIRTVAFRIGLVLSTEGGALPKLKMSLPFGIAPYFSDGRQWYSWIHIDDVCRMFIHGIENELTGFFNAVAPEPVRNRELVAAMVRASKYRAIILPVPAFALRIALGEMADTVLSGSRVSAETVVASGFSFQFPRIEQAFADLLG